MDTTYEISSEPASLSASGALPTQNAPEHQDERDAKANNRLPINPKYVKAVLQQLEKKREKLNAARARTHTIRRRMREHEATMFSTMRRPRNARTAGIMISCVDNVMMLSHMFRKTVASMMHYAGSAQSFREVFTLDRLGRLLSHPGAEFIRADVQRINSLLISLNLAHISLRNTYPTQIDEPFRSEVDLARTRMMMMGLQAE